MRSLMLEKFPQNSDHIILKGLEGRDKNDSKKKIIVPLQSVANRLKKEAEIPLWQCISWNANQDTVLCEMVSAETLHKNRNAYCLFI